MNQKRNTLIKTIIFISLFLSVVEGFVCVANLYKLPGDIDRTFLLGVSFSRAILLFLLLIFTIVCLISGLLIIFNKRIWQYILNKIMHNARKISFFSGFLFILFSWFVLFPSYRFGAYTAYYDRLRPIVIWLTLFSFQGFLTAIANIYLQTDKPKKSNNDNKYIRPFLFFLSVMMFVLVLICFTKWGIYPIVRFWEKTGVPLLSGQEYWIISICFIVLLLIPINFPKPIDHDSVIKKYQWVFFFGIWIISAFLWILEPIQFNHFNPGPYPPNYQHYPNSDAQYYDLSAQRALLGQDQFDIDKPLYSALLLTYHLIAGQNTNLMIGIQCGLFASFPALLFLLGIKVHRPITGILAAIITNFRVINSIAGQLWIWKTSSPKLMMTEFPSAILLALLTVMLWGWFTSKQNRIVYAIASGGVLALATLVRHNNWIFLPTIIVFSIIVFWKNKRHWAKSVSVFIISTFLILTPMIIFSQNHYGVSFIFSQAMKGSVIAQRYNLITNNSQDIQVNSDSTNDILNSMPNDSVESITSPQTNISQNLNSDIQLGRVVSERGSTSQPVNVLGETDYLIFNPLIDTMVRHFFHNLISTGLSTPLSIEFHSLEYLLQDSPYVSLWDIKWNGKLPLISWILVIKNIVIFCIALAFCWRKWRWAGLTPLVIMGAYYVGNGIATTSGGRYLIPVDWVFYFYFALGWVVLFDLFALFIDNTQKHILWDCEDVTISNNQNKFLWKINIPIFVFFLSIVALVALGLNGFQQVFPDYSQEEIISLIHAKKDINQEELKPYLFAVENGDLQIVHGRFLYPQYLSFSDDKDFELDIPTWDENVPALIFTVLSNENDFINGRIILDVPPENKLPDGVEAIVFTCPNYDAYALLLLSENENYLLTRSGMGKIVCE